MDKPIIPVIIGNAGIEKVLPDWLQGIVYLDARRLPLREVAKEVIRTLTNNSIAKRDHSVHKLRATDATGRWAYYFVLVDTELEAAFLEALRSLESIDLEDYGQVIASSYEEEPSEEVKVLLKEKYGFTL